MSRSHAAKTRLDAHRCTAGQLLDLMMRVEGTSRLTSYQCDSARINERYKGYTGRVAAGLMTLQECQTVIDQLEGVY